MKKFNLFFKSIFCIFIIESAFSSCALSVSSSSPENEEPEETHKIRGLYADGGDEKVNLEWAPITITAKDTDNYTLTLKMQKVSYVQQWNAETKQYDVIETIEFEIPEENVTAFSGHETVEVSETTPVSDEKNIEESANIISRALETALPGTCKKTFTGLENVSPEKNHFFYRFTMCLYKGEELIQKEWADATTAGSLEYKGEMNEVIFRLFPADSVSVNKYFESPSPYDVIKQVAVPSIIKQLKNTLPIYNNTSAIAKILQDSGVDLSEFNEYPGENETIEWFSFYPQGYRNFIAGRIVNKTAKEKGYTEVSEYTVNTAYGKENSIETLDKAFRPGTFIRTKGYSENGDGGEALYEISSTNPEIPINRAGNRNFSSLKTAAGQWCLLRPEDHKLNLKQLGGGNCWQVKSSRIREWLGMTKEERLLNDDGARIMEAIHLLQESRLADGKLNGKDAKVEDYSVPIELYIPRGQYRVSTQINILVPNFKMYGDTQTRHLKLNEIDAFEETFALGDESGSSSFNGSVLYTDNGSGCSHLNIYGPSYDVLVEGLTFESRETDSKRTFWFVDKNGNGSPSDDEDERYFTPHSGCAVWMADQQWYSREVMISQCHDITIKNCEFIITSHIRDQAVYPAAQNSRSDMLDFGGAYGEYIDSEKNVSQYHANPYVESCDLHTDKQFTNVSLYSGWKNITVDGCLMYNMAGVFRGANLGYLDFYSEECANGTVSNCTLYHNCHDEQIGIFTLQDSNAAYKPTECIKGANFLNNRVYSMRDEHVDKIKTRIMVFTVGYPTSKNITGVRIQGNYFYAKDLPSKLFTFGGAVSQGRNETLIENNTFELEGYSGFYLFETMLSYIKIRNNTFNYNPNPDGTGTTSGIIADVRFVDKNTPYEVEFSGNTINVNGNFGSRAFSGERETTGKFCNNTFNISGYCGTVCDSARVVQKNVVNAGGKIYSFYETRGEYKGQILIDGNTLNSDFDDSGDSYKEHEEGSLYHSGRQGYTFANITGFLHGEGNIVISNNKINCTKCTTRNKHFIRYVKDDNTNFTVLAKNNMLGKYKWLRGVKDDETGQFITYINNRDEKGNVLKKEDWYVNLLSFEDTE